MKMKKLFRVLILPAMMMASLSGCGSSGDKTDFNEFCAKAADTAPLLLNSSTGKEILPSTHKRELSGYNSVLGLKSFKYQEKELKVDWELTPNDKWTASTYIIDPTRVKLTPNYNAEGFDASLKAVVSYSEGETVKGSTEISWQFTVAPSTVVELSLEQINTNFVNNGNKLGNMAKDDEGKDVIIGTRGYITATYEQPDHTYAGVFISDGVYSLQLYAGKLSDLWTENKLKVGDCVFAVGPLSMYGIIEMKPTLMEVIDPEAYHIAKAAEVDLTGKELQTDKNMWLNQSSLVTLPGCTYKSGLDKYAVGKHSTLVFTCGEQDVKLYCSYHLGDTMMTAIKTIAEGLEENGSTVTLKGVLTYSSTDSDFEIIPIFGATSFVAANS